MGTFQAHSDGTQITGASDAVPPPTKGTSVVDFPDAVDTHPTVELFYDAVDDVHYPRSTAAGDYTVVFHLEFTRAGGTGDARVVLVCHTDTVVVFADEIPIDGDLTSFDLERTFAAPADPTKIIGALANGIDEPSSSWTVGAGSYVLIAEPVARGWRVGRIHWPSPSTCISIFTADETIWADGWAALDLVESGGSAATVGTGGNHIVLPEGTWTVDVSLVVTSSSAVSNPRVEWYDPFEPVDSFAMDDVGSGGGTIVVPPGHAYAVWIAYDLTSPEGNVQISGGTISVTGPCE